MRLVEAYGLPDNPVDAAAQFMTRAVPQVRAAVRADDVPLCIIFDPADHTHSAWRIAAVQSLAREAAPARVNGVAGSDEGALAATIAYLERAPGVTGQYFPLDDQGAANPAHYSDAG